MESIPSLLRELRQRLGWPQQRLAERAGVSIRTVAGHEAGRPADAASLAKVAATAAEHGQDDIAAAITAHMVRALQIDRPILLASFQRESKDDPIESAVLITSRDSVEARYLSAFTMMLAMLRSKDPAQRQQATEVLEQLDAAAR